MPAIKSRHCDLMVIGSGMAGMAAALFAARRGIKTVQVVVTGEINFASGLLDLLGVHPVDEGVCRADPWKAIRQLVTDEPDHPYARLSIVQIEQALQACIEFLDAAGLSYRIGARQNSQVVTPAGTLKTTYAVPQSMYAGVEALAARQATLLVDFHGLKGFSARQIIETLGTRWPGLRRLRLDFPEMRGELYTEQAARKLDTEPIRRKLVAAIRPHLGSVEAVGLPAILGLYRTGEVLADLEESLGLPVFEIPTMVPTVTGLRLREAFERQLPKMGVQAFYQQRVLEVTIRPDGGFRFVVGHPFGVVAVTAPKAILASGRFFGKGLQAERHGIRETIFDLPVVQPAERRQWHHRDFLHTAGHPVNRAGLAIDQHFRPVDERQQVLHRNLYAAGSILAHQDWIRQKCGSGLAIATAFGAVRAAASQTG